jgi:hypothetical protein
MAATRRPACLPLKACFATIVSPNYIAYARVLRDSIRLHAPEAAFRVLVVNSDDAATRHACAQAQLDAVFAPQLGLPDFEQLAYRFDLVELNTALKPTFLKRLFAEGFDTVTYLDPDIRVYDAMQPVDDALARSEIVLIPHSLAPVMDGLRPSDIDFLRTGAYNLGFIGLRRGAQCAALLDWWERRCLSHGFNDPGFGIFVDQKWLDLAPAYFDSVAILKHRGCNVAYWNLHERQLAHEGGRWRVNGEPLVFFHFSGVDPADASRLSRHQDRHRPAPGSALAQLVADYCASLAAAGHAGFKSLPYSYATLSDGTRITTGMRRAARVRGVDAHDPFNPGSPLQRLLRRAGIAAPPGKVRQPQVTTLNFDPTDRRVVWFNFLLRQLARIIGASRLGELLRYATFLGWGSNSAAVLLDRPFELRHIDDRKAGSP